MKRTIVLISILMLISCVAALAQNDPRAEVFGGYQYFHASTGNGGPSFSLNGWDASLSGYFNHYLGITGDFSGTYGSPFGVSAHLYTYMFGPELRAANHSPLQPYAHVLFGGSHISGSVSGIGSASDSGFAWAAGGGIDYKVMPVVAIRLGQFDFLQTHLGNDSQNNFRYSAGVVLRF